MLDRYILVNPERYNAGFKQSMSSGKIFFEFSVKAGTKKELFKESEEILIGLTNIANTFNKEVEKEHKKQSSNKGVKGLE